MRVDKRLTACSVGAFVFIGAIVALNGSAGAIDNCGRYKNDEDAYSECWLNQSGGRNSIISVQWAADVKFKNQGENVCALWVGPYDNSTTDIVDLGDLSGVYVDYMSGDIKYRAGVYGMCTADGGVYNTALDVKIQSDDPGVQKIFEGFPIASLTRGPWGNPGGGGSIVINISEMIRQADDDTSSVVATPDAFGGVTYELEKVSVSRRHYGYDSCGPQKPTYACGTNPVIIRFRVPAELLDQSKASAGDASVDTDIASKWAEGSASTTVKPGEFVDVSFSHSLYSSAEISNADWKIIVTETKSPGLTYVTEPSSVNTMTSGSVALSRKFGEYYTTNSGTISEGTNYKIKFSGTGKYVRCEQLYSAGFPGTIVCVEINVEGSGANYYAISNVAVRDSLSNTFKYETTNMTSGGTAYDSLGNVNVDKDVYVIFSHNVYSSQAVNGVSWELVRPSITGSGGVSIEKRSLCKHDGAVNFVNTDNNSYGYLVGDPRECKNEANQEFVARDVYVVRFSDSNATVKMCEKVFVNGVQKTEVCAIVTPKTGGNSCDEFGSVIAGRTYTISQVRNNSTSMNSWSDYVYAKPNDNVSWIHCYYPGVQEYYDETVSSNHAYHNTAAGSRPSNTNVLFSEFGTWENKFSVTSDSTSPYDSDPIGYRFSRILSTGDSRVHGSGETNETNPNPTPNSYDVKASDDSYILTEEIKTGYPAYVSFNNEGKHSWGCDYGESCDICGQYTAPPCTESEDESGGKTVTCTEYCYSCYRETCSHDNNYITNIVIPTASNSRYGATAIRFRHISH